jgi:hypothetical protein
MTSLESSGGKQLDVVGHVEKDCMGKSALIHAVERAMTGARIQRCPHCNTAGYHCAGCTNLDCPFCRCRYCALCGSKLQDGLRQYDHYNIEKICPLALPDVGKYYRMRVRDVAARGGGVRVGGESATETKGETRWE